MENILGIILYLPFPVLLLKEKIMYWKLIFFFLLHCVVVSAQLKNTAADYIAKYKEAAIQEMLESGVPASITLSQGLLESGCGNSELAISANNHFGIKCHNDWEHEVYILDDDSKNECFRKYETVLDSYRDHAIFLCSRPRYDSLFKLPFSDYKSWAKGLKKAGYATNPKYAELLIGIIERNRLFKLDSIIFSFSLDSLVSIRNQFVAQIKNKTFVSVDKKKRAIYYNNKVPFVILANKDNFKKIAKDMNMEVVTLYKYNEVTVDSLLKPGQIVYIKKKRKRADALLHVVKKAENLWEISQKYGIRLKKLRRINKKESDECLTPNTIVKLR